MWALSVSAFTVAATAWTRKKPAELGAVAMSATLLFALPAVRNCQPGIPAIGITADIAGFFFNMFLIAIALILNMWSYILNRKKDTPKPAPQLRGAETEAFLNA
ncbi:hypothetical protein BC833DRAFT_606690 [Globomyces pollinis-pini]|nr:hypothetical protein BC833DRAFT_606690 [Globomyces pollinis-pini]